MLDGENQLARHQDGRKAFGAIGIYQSFCPRINRRTYDFLEKFLAQASQPVLFHPSVGAIEDLVKQSTRVMLNCDQEGNTCCELSIFQDGAQPGGIILGIESVTL